MQFISSINTETLEKLDQLAAQYEVDKKAFRELNDILQTKTLAAYKTKSIAISNTASLGDQTTVKTSHRLPKSFSNENSQLINETKESFERMSDSRASLSVFKHILIDSIAVEHVAQYESLAASIADTHAIIASIEKYKGSFNACLWNKIRIPAGSNISRLRERADQPLGAAMLHYDHKAKMLTQRYSKELKDFLAID